MGHCLMRPRFIRDEHRKFARLVVSYADLADLLSEVRIRQLEQLAPTRSGASFLGVLMSITRCVLEAQILECCLAGSGPRSLCEGGQ